MSFLQLSFPLYLTRLD